jgi:hypothetical protein
MDVLGGLIPVSVRRPLLAGSQTAQSEKPVPNCPDALRPGASAEAFSHMLGLLETLRNLVRSGQEPASFLIALPDRRHPAVMAATADPRAHLQRLEGEYGSIALAFYVCTRPSSGGIWLEVRDMTRSDGYRLEQFCRPATSSAMQVWPPCWRRVSRSSPGAPYGRKTGPAQVLS